MGEKYFSDSAIDSNIIDILEKNAQEGMILIIEQYTGLLWKVISHHLDNPEDIKECINDTFTQFYLHRDRFDVGKASLPVYLTSIARNLAVSCYRKESRHKAEPLPMDYSFTDKQIETAEMKADLEAALTELGEDELQIIRMKYYGGMTVHEIADSLNLPYETVKKRHQRSISKLRRTMLITLLVLLLALVSACAYRVLVYYEIIPDFLHIGIREESNDKEDDSADDTGIGDDTRSAAPLVIDSSPLNDMSEELPGIHPESGNSAEPVESLSSEVDDTLPMLTWIPGYGSTKIFNECGDCHNHRFCTVTGEAIYCNDKHDHFHEVKFHTDFSDEHFHEFCGKTSGAIDVGNGKHVHFIKDFTEEKDNHKHEFQAATLIDSPIDFKCK